MTRHPLLGTWVLVGTLMLAYALSVGISALFLAPWLDEAITLQEMAGSWLQMKAMPQASGLTTVGALPTPPTDLADPASLLLHLYAYDVHPPFYYLLASAWSHAFGLGAPQLRALSLLASGVGALCALLAVRHIAPARSTHAALLIAAFLLIASPSLLFAAGNIRSYATALACIGVAFWAMGRLWSTPSHHSAWFAAAGFAGGLAFFSHYFSILALGGAMLACAAHHWRRPKAVLSGILAFGIPTLITWPYAQHHLGARPGQHHGFGDILPEIGAAILSLTAPLLALPSKTLVHTLPTIGIALATLALAVRLRRHMPAITPALVAVLTYPVFLFVLFCTTDKTLQATAYSARYATPILIPALIVLATTAAYAATRWTAVARVAPVAITVAATVFLWVGVPNTAARTLPWSHHNLLAPHAALMAQHPEQSLIILPAWHSNEGPTLLPQFAPDIPVFVATTLDGYTQALTLATSKRYVAIVGLYRWTGPPSTVAQTQNTLIASGLFTQPTPETWLLTRSPN